MKNIAVAAALLSAAGLSSCEQKPKPVPEPTFEQLGENAPGTDGPLGWLEADGAGETAAVYRAGPNAVEFSLTCSQVEKTLAIRAETPAPFLPQESPATFFAGAAAFQGEATLVTDTMQVAMTLPVTPTLLKALTEAKSARVTIGDAFTETAPDDKQALAHLSQSCALITGVKPD